MDSSEIQNIVRLHEQFYDFKLENWEEMDIFLEPYDLSKLNEEVESLNGSIKVRKNETIINNLHKKNSSGPNGFTGEF